MVIAALLPTLWQQRMNHLELNSKDSELGRGGREEFCLDRPLNVRFGS